MCNAHSAGLRIEDRGQKMCTTDNTGVKSVTHRKCRVQECIKQSVKRPEVHNAESAVLRNM